MCAVCARDFLERTLDGAGTRPVVACRAVQRHTQTDAAVGETLKRLLVFGLTSLTLGLNLRLSTTATIARARGRRSCWRAWRHLPLAKQHPRTTIVPRATLDADRMQREKHRPPLARSLGWRAKKDHPAPLPGSFSSAPPPKVSRSGQRSAAKGVALGWSQAGRVGRVGWSGRGGGRRSS